jgi:hypothetical protein
MTSKQKYKPISCDRLSKITINQLQKWCNKYNLELIHNKVYYATFVYIKHKTECRTAFWGVDDKYGIKATLQYIDFIKLLELKSNMKYIDHHDYANNSKEIYELVDELEAM